MGTETSALSGLEPRAFWEHFEKLTKIARPSRGEEPVSEYVRAWGAERGYEVRQDAAHASTGLRRYLGATRMRPVSALAVARATSASKSSARAGRRS